MDTAKRTTISNQVSVGIGMGVTLVGKRSRGLLSAGWNL
jgi:hypothetical protein